MQEPKEIPIAIQTLYAELIERAWTGNVADLTKKSAGTPYVRDVDGKKYWYWRTSMKDGNRPPPLYIGPDTEDVRKRIQSMKETVESRRQRRDMVRALRAAGLPTPDAMSGDVMAALAEAGVFRLRAVVVGSVAFQTYSGLLGYHTPASASRTGDLDIAQFQSIAVAIDDEIECDLESVLKTVDKRFESIPYAMDGRRVLRYALRVGGDERFKVDVLSPMIGPDSEKIANLPAIRSDAQLLRYLDFLIYRETNAVALHGDGIPINVPDPTRYALHKMIVARMRRQENSASAAKSRKDLDQAAALIAILAKTRPDDLRDFWLELRERGPSWRQKADESLEILPEAIRTLLTKTARPEIDNDEANYRMPKP